jgi:cardiolipin synthase
MVLVGSGKVSPIRAALTTSGRVLALVPALFRPRRSDPESALPWASERLILDGDAWFEQMIQDISQARKWVTLEVYIFSDDEIGSAIAKALGAAAQRGVEVRLLVDGVGSGPWLRSAARHLLNAGIRVRVYHPTPWSIVPFSWGQGWALPRFSRLFRWINRRNHRKVLVVDRRIAMVGSFNVERCHSRAQVGERAWRDTGARVEGPGVRTLERAFARAWRQSWQLTPRSAHPSLDLPLRQPRIPTAHLVRVNQGARLRDRWHHEMLSRIGSASQRVWITSAYFIPHRQLLYALSLAAAAGADVRVLVPLHSDHWFIPFVTRAFYQRLVESGVHVFEYQPTMLHAKTLLADDWACVGSTNLNHRSMLHDLEADVVLTGAKARDELMAAYLLDISRSREVVAAHWRSWPWYRRWFGRAALNLKHWM